MKTDILVKDIMVQDIVKADMNVDTKEATRMMIKYDVDSIVVLNNGEPVGIVTERDIVREVVMMDIKSSGVKLKDIMTTPLITVSPSDSLFDVARKMAREKIRRIPVIEGGKLAGIVADVDIISVSSGINSIFAELIEMNVEREIEKRGGEEMGGICEKCGILSNDLKIKDGMMVCESCMEEM